jgi:ureidoacrylate peracid hydrolase
MRKLEEWVDPRKTALIVIDVQNDFCHPEGACASAWGGPRVVEHILAAMPTLHRLIDAARTAGLQIVFIRSIYDPEYLSPARRWQQERRGATDLCRSNAWGAEFYEGIRPDPERGEIVVVKHRFNAFAGTVLDAELRERGITAVICAGFTTSVCVESTARDAFFHDYHAMIAADAVAEFDPELHRSTLRLFDRSFGPTPTVDQIVAAWEGAGSPPAGELSVLAKA